MNLDTFRTGLPKDLQTKIKSVDKILINNQEVFYGILDSKYVAGEVRAGGMGQTLLNLLYGESKIGNKNILFLPDNENNRRYSEYIIFSEQQHKQSQGQYQGMISGEVMREDIYKLTKNYFSHQIDTTKELTIEGLESALDAFYEGQEEMVRIINNSLINSPKK